MVVTLCVHTAILSAHAALSTSTTTIPIEDHVRPDAQVGSHASVHILISKLVVDTLRIRGIGGLSPLS